MSQADVELSKEEILAKYPNGSPQYPSHHEGCGCSGCWASWAEWRSGHKAHTLAVASTVEKIAAWLRTQETIHPGGQYFASTFRKAIEDGEWKSDALKAGAK